MTTCRSATTAHEDVPERYNRRAKPIKPPARPCRTRPTCHARPPEPFAAWSCAAAPTHGRAKRRTVPHWHGTGPHWHGTGPDPIRLAMRAVCAFAFALNATASPARACHPAVRNARADRLAPTRAGAGPGRLRPQLFVHGLGLDGSRHEPRLAASRCDAMPPPRSFRPDVSDWDVSDSKVSASELPPKFGSHGRAHSAPVVASPVPREPGFPLPQNRHRQSQQHQCKPST
jgi:hypothetical protein